MRVSRGEYSQALEPTQAELHRYRPPSLNDIEDRQVINRLEETGKVVLHGHFELARAWRSGTVISRCMHCGRAKRENGSRSRTARHINTQRTTISRGHRRIVNNCGSRVRIQRQINHNISRTRDHRRSRVDNVHHHVVCIRSTSSIRNSQRDRVRAFG